MWSRAVAAPSAPMWGQVRPSSPARPAVLVVLLAALGVTGLRDVQVTVPVAAAVGDTVFMHCKYDLESDSLYSVKWYKGRQEFFRYIPKELPHTRVFPLPGVDVDVGRSGPATVVLRAVPSSLSGRYRCEVSADAPSFHTAMKTSYMHVVELPDSAPVITAEKSRITLGGVLRVQCTAPAAHPPANLTWLLNNVEIKGTPIDLDSIPITPPNHQQNLYNHQGHVHLVSSFGKHLENDSKPSFHIQNLYNHHGGQGFLVTSSNKHDENDTKLYSNFFPRNGEEIERLNEDKKPIRKRYFIGREASEMSESGRGNGTEKGVADSSEDDRATSENKLDSELGATVAGQEEQTVKQRSASALDLVIEQESFQQGRLTLTCKATVFSLYNAQAHLILEGEKPQIASVLGTRESSSGSFKMSWATYKLYGLLLLLLQIIIYR